jgi:hypothetical protein
LKAFKIDERFNEIIEKYLQKLEEIKIVRFCGENFEEFVDLYNKQIKKISFEYPSKEWNQKVIPYLSRFERLESLYLGIKLRLFFWVWFQISINIWLWFGSGFCDNLSIWFWFVPTEPKNHFSKILQLFSQIFFQIS